MSDNNIGLLTNELSRVFMVNIVPGFISSLPMILALQIKYPNIGLFLQGNTEVLLILSFIISYSVGVILEDVGSNIEGIYCEKQVLKKLVYDSSEGKKREDIKEEFERRWRDYLKLEITKDKTYVGHKFIHNMVTRLKFELTVGLSIIICNISLYMTADILNFHIPCFINLVIFVIPYYLIIVESPRTAHSLDNTRKALLDM